MADKAWVQFLLVAVPVLSLVGAWLALRVVGERPARRRPREADRTADAAARGEQASNISEAIDR